MPEIKGPLLAVSNALPSGVDGSRIAQWKLREGRTYDQVRGEVLAALDGLNAELLRTYGDMIYVTTDDFLEYPNGGTLTDMPYVTELDRPVSGHGDTVGHTIPLRHIADAIGGSEIFFRDTREAKILATMRDKVQRGRNTFEKAILTRATSGAENLLGTSGYDVGFASASASVTFTPPSYGGQNFASSHTHYVGYNSSSSDTWATMLNGLTKHVAEHGHVGPYIAIVPEADVATIRALDGYVMPVVPVVSMMDRGGLTSGATLFTNTQSEGVQPSGARFIGYFQTTFGTVELRATYRLTTGYAFVYKSYGMNDPKNPLAVRIHPDAGFGFRVKEIPSFDTTWPIKQIEFHMEFGVSCNKDRMQGAAGLLVAGGTWAAPTIG